MRIASLGFVVDDGRVLLGEKKTGAEVGSGKLNGAGGKLEPEDQGSLEACLVREFRQEFGIAPTAYTKAAIVRFFAADELQFEVHVYLITAYEGVLEETREMFLPSWYDIADLPLERMHDGDRHWIAEVFSGTPFNADIYYERPGEGFVRKELRPGCND